MVRPRPGRSALVITDSSVPGKYALQRKLQYINALTFPLAEKRQDIATSTGDMAAIQQQAMRHVITITNSIFFLMANSRTLATADTVSFMEALAGILSELGVNTQAHENKIDQKKLEITINPNALLVQILSAVQQLSSSTAHSTI